MRIALSVDIGTRKIAAVAFDCLAGRTLVALTGQMHGVLLAAKDLEPLSNLMPWRDRGASALVSSLDRDAWPVGRTGRHLHAGYGTHMQSLGSFSKWKE